MQKLTTCFDLSQAEQIELYLSTYDIDVHIPDRHTAAMAWHYSQAIGGIRVMVPAEQLSLAQNLMENFKEPFKPLSKKTGEQRKKSGHFNKMLLFSSIMTLIVTGLILMTLT